MLLLRRERIQPLYEALLSLNLAHVLCYLFVAFRLHRLSYIPGQNQDEAYSFLYYYLRGAVRINNFLHLRSSDPFASWGRLPGPGSQVGVTLVFLISMVAIAVLFFSILRTTLGRKFCNQLIGGLLASFAFPVAYLGFSVATSPLPVSGGFLAIALPELLVLFALLLVNALRPLSAWILSPSTLLHYGFWLLAVGRLAFADTIYGFIPPRITLLIFPACGTAWLLQVVSQRRQPIGRQTEKPRNGWLYVLAAVSAAFAGGVWLPGWGYSLAHAKHLESLQIEMSRTLCQLACPSYTITIKADGTVQYVGRNYVRQKGPITTTIGPNDIRQILEGFDRAGFFTLEDRAFAWGFHSSRAIVRITVDGRSKEVSSDSYYVGAKTGQQARFVKAVQEIDRIVGSDRWISCKPERCPP